MTTRTLIRKALFSAALLGSFHAWAADPSSTQAVDVDDQFFDDVHANYQSLGKPEWLSGMVRLGQGAGIARAATMLPDLEFAADLWPKGDPQTSECTTRLSIITSNNWEVVVVIFRGVHEGQNYRQAIVAEINRGGTAERPESELNELRRLPAFTVAGDVEHWKISYHWGVIAVSCNGRQVGTAYSSAFSSWPQAAVVTQDKGVAELSRYTLSASPAGYSENQLVAYKQTLALREQAEQMLAGGDLVGAIQLERKRLPLIQQAFGNDDFALGLVHQWIAGHLRGAGKIDESREEYDLAAATFEKSLGPTHPEVLYTRVLAASLTTQLGDLVAAETALRSAALQLRRIAGETSPLSKSAFEHLASILILRAEQSLAAGRFAEVQRYRQEEVAALSAVLPAEDWRLKQAQRDLALAERLAAAEGPDQRKIAEIMALREQANAAAATGGQQKAEVALRQMVDLCGEVLGEDHPLRAGAMVALATCVGSRGAYGEATWLLESAVAIHRRATSIEEANLAIALTHLGALQSQVGRFKDADERLREAATICVEAKQTRDDIYANVQLESGRNLIRMGRPQEAARPLQAALKIYMDLDRPADALALAARERLADVCRAANDLAGAESYLAQQHYFVELSYPRESWPYIQMVMSDARHLMMRSEFAAAVVKYEEARSLAASSFGRNSQAYASVLDGLIEAYAWNDDAQAAIKLLHESLDFERLRRESLFGVYSERLQLEQSWADLISLGRLLRLTVHGDVPAEEAYRHILALKGAVTEQQRSIRAASRNPELKPLVDRLSKSNSHIAALIARVDQPNAREALDKAVDRRESIQAELVRMSAAGRAAAAPPSVAELRAALPDDAALIDFVEYNRLPGFLDRLLGRPGARELAAFVITKNRETALVELGSSATIDHALTDWILALIVEPYIEATDDVPSPAKATDLAGDKVRQLIWDPLESALGSAHTILVCGAGPITMCPLAAMPQRDLKSFLVEDRSFAYIISPRAIVRWTNSPLGYDEPKILLVGDVDYGSTGSAGGVASLGQESPQPFATLPSSKSTFEAINLAATQAFDALQVESVTGLDASESRLRSALAGQNFVHLETHGFCVPLSHLLAGTDSTNPDEAEVLVGGIALANANRAMAEPHEDGVVWADELTTLDLSAAELVVLSACQSALGPDVPTEGQLGPHRAMYVAGAKSTLATLWSVEVAPTRELLNAFYRNLWVNKLSKAESLRQAQVSILRGGANHQPNERTPPAKWAWFVLHGDWR